MSDDLCARLQDASEAGVFRLSCPVAILEANVALSDMTLFEANMPAGCGKGGFLAILAQALKAPGWFGHNWDALADVLGDLSWQPATGYVLLLNSEDAKLGLSDGDHASAMEIFEETVLVWKAQGKPFWVFLADEK
jgi:hypothetical protein